MRNGFNALAEFASICAPWQVVKFATDVTDRVMGQQRERALTEAEIAYLKYSAEHYVRVKNNYQG